MSGDETKRPPPGDWPSEEEPMTEQELEEAQALAAALERGPGRKPAPAGYAGGIQLEVEAAALLRVSQDLELGTGRQASILEALVAGQGRKESARAASQAVARSPWKWWWLLPLPAVAFTGLIVMQRQPAELLLNADHPMASDGALALPGPSSALLEAQAKLISVGVAAAAESLPSRERTAQPRQAVEEVDRAPAAPSDDQGHGEALAQYDRAMTEYRGQWLSALNEQYQP